MRRLRQPAQALPGSGHRAGIETPRLDSNKAAAYANGGLIALVQYDEYGSPVEYGPAP